MYQANPDLDPFAIRNIMQETSVYRVCHYMAANEPCAEDGIPKNRQNNVYGHGQVEALPAVMEAANTVYNFSTSISTSLETMTMEDNKVHIGNSDEIQFSVNGVADKVQWRTWDMRDNWMDLEDFNSGDSTFEIDHSLLVDRLKYLPGNTIEGNQTLMVRVLKDTESSANLVVHTHVMVESNIVESEEDSPSIPFNLVVFTSLMVALYRSKRT